MNSTATITSRQTKYAKSVLEALQKLGHATNLELINEIQQMYPEVSATTIHRVSARLKDRGIIGCAPKSANGSERYDFNSQPHHHFTCTTCGRVCDLPDTPEAQIVVNQLKQLSGECALAGTLTMQGVCKSCVKGGL